MKRLLCILVFLCTSLVSSGQELGAVEFYQYLKKAIEKSDSAPITLTTTEYGCLGSNIHWTAHLQKRGRKVRVDFYSQRPTEYNNPSSELESVLETTFAVAKSTLQKRLDAEVTELITRPVLIEKSFKIIIHQGGTNKEFRFWRGEGLSYILRDNETLGSRFARKRTSH